MTRAYGRLWKTSPIGGKTFVSRDYGAFDPVDTVVAGHAQSLDTPLPYALDASDRRKGALSGAGQAFLSITLSPWFECSTQ